MLVQTCRVFAKARLPIKELCSYKRPVVVHSGMATASTAVAGHVLVKDGEVVPCDKASGEWLKNAPRGMRFLHS